MLSQQNPQDGSFAVEAPAAHGARELAEELSGMAPDEGRLLSQIFESVTRKHEMPGHVLQVDAIRQGVPFFFRKHERLVRGDGERASC